MSNEKVRNQDADDDAQNEWFASLTPMSKRDSAQIMAWYDDTRIGTETVRFGGRVFFELETRNLVLEIKCGEKLLTVVCSLKKFVKKLTGVAIQELWNDAGLQP